MLKQTLITLFLILATLNAEVITNTSTKTVEGTGHGLSRQEAINSAIVEAIGQLNGVSIKKEVLVDDSSIESSNGDKSAYKYNSKIKKITHGKADSYSILEVNELFKGKFEATVSISKTKRSRTFKSPGLSTKSRRTITIVPFYTQSKKYYIGSKTYSAFKMSSMVSQALATDITQSRRFAVVDRTYTRSIADELNLLKSGAVSQEQKVKLGKILGADYLLVGNIQSASLSQKNSHNQSTGEKSSKSSAEFIVDYRIIVLGTSQVKWSDTAVLEVDTNSNSSTDIALQDALNKLSAYITNSLLNNIYPIKIAKITPMGEIILNQGGSLVQKGSIFNVYKIGDKIYDPYTKESLGYEETKVGEITITKVNPKNSYATATRSSLSLMKKGDICRRESINSASLSAQDNKNWRKSSVKIEDGGGVRLPFD
ncbi:MAG: CsgG/HfaB family protein [Campylobacterota bacterium]|nr:CsgG/HfaB family protein [Campylobacterota bacterium]